MKLTRKEKRSKELAIGSEKRRERGIKNEKNRLSYSWMAFVLMTLTIILSLFYSESNSDYLNIQRALIIVSLITLIGFTSLVIIDNTMFSYCIKLFRTKEQLNNIEKSNLIWTITCCVALIGLAVADLSISWKCYSLGAVVVVNIYRVMKAITKAA